MPRSADKHLAGSLGYGETEVSPASASCPTSSAVWPHPPEVLENTKARPAPSMSPGSPTTASGPDTATENPKKPPTGASSGAIRRHYASRSGPSGTHRPCQYPAPALARRPRWCRHRSPPSSRNRCRAGHRTQQVQRSGASPAFLREHVRRARIVVVVSAHHDRGTRYGHGAAEEVATWVSGRAAVRSPAKRPRPPVHVGHASTQHGCANDHQ